MVVLSEFITSICSYHSIIDKYLFPIVLLEFVISIIKFTRFLYIHNKIPIEGSRTNQD